MKSRHSFRFVDDRLNQRLIAVLKKKAPGKFAVGGDGSVHYAHRDEDLIGNDLISAIRSVAFPAWQVVACPADWVNSYKRYMICHKIPFREEVRDAQLRFLIPRNYRPHSWKLEEPEEHLRIAAAEQACIPTERRRAVGE